MIKANELRIGNWVLSPFWGIGENPVSGTPKQIEQICQNEPYLPNLGVWFDNRKEWVEAKSLNGIPLNEEWLAKFGFTKSMGYWREDKHMVLIGEFDDDMRLTTSDDDKVSMPIKFVHQLQNLYFALTGEELTIR